ncbi:hypothetical protein CROQUDRAFT_136272 [Cronartium quercuum f. sp. fusiforme G11]|uniref:Uncharacterized protein n=1 Tax=Cronartium quercuum f. sp. fusiforme G11 TaxID=708437 RepID=A0A9P6N7B4_9BASI|nr:hypothetical protein CROQUDRAFT_136272 [Cronartium quercuum f. sp. fusiforme G11]
MENNSFQQDFTHPDQSNSKACTCDVLVGQKNITASRLLEEARETLKSLMRSQCPKKWEPKLGESPPTIPTNPNASLKNNSFTNRNQSNSLTHFRPSIPSPLSKVVIKGSHVIVEEATLTVWASRELPSSTADSEGTSRSNVEGQRSSSKITPRPTLRRSKTYQFTSASASTSASLELEPVAVSSTEVPSRRREVLTIIYTLVNVPSVWWSHLQEIHRIIVRARQLESEKIDLHAPVYNEYEAILNMLGIDGDG